MAFALISTATKLSLELPWRFLHFLVTLWFLVEDIINTIKNVIASSGLLPRFRNLDLTNLRYLAVVVESEQARDSSKVVQLLQWLVNIGVKHVSLYDMEGELKKSKEVILKNCNAKLWEEANEKNAVVHHSKITLEFLSVSDGKEAVTKAANYLIKNLESSKLDGGHKQPAITESDVSDALKAIGCGGPEPDLLLIFAPVRCHLGFPAWRMRYTELVHMGSLESLRYGAVLRVIRKFTLVHQNYGT